VRLVGSHFQVHKLDHLALCPALTHLERTGLLPVGTANVREVVHQIHERQECLETWVARNAARQRLKELRLHHAREKGVLVAVPVDGL